MESHIQKKYKKIIDNIICKMLKYIPILLFILSPFSLSYGQKAANLMKNYVPSPEAYALMQYEAIPVSKHWTHSG